MYNKTFMELAIAEAEAGIRSGDGGPFGAVIVKDGEVVASGHNCVLKNHDATCHSEVNAIRKAGQELGTHDLTGCQMYATSEPCPMCLAAILWANIDKVYYGCSLEDCAELGFRDVKFDEMMGGRANLPEEFLQQKDREACLEVFEEYNNIADRVIY